MVGFFTYFTPVISVIALILAGYFVAHVKKYDEGTAEMREIAEAIRIGARAYIKRQYFVVALFFVVMFVVGLLCLVEFFRHWQDILG